MINFQTSRRYRHWKLEVDGAVANLSMDVQEDGLWRRATSASSTLMIWASTLNSRMRCSGFASSTRKFRWW